MNLWPRAALPGAALLLLGSCGYVGPIVPPSPLIPVAVTDVAAQEVGDQLVVTFTPPARTTDEFVIRGFSSWDLRVTTGSPDSGKDYDVPVKTGSVEYSVPAADWVGQKITVYVRTAIKSNGKYSAWSNPAQVSVIEPLKAPVVSQEATAEGYKLSWQDLGQNVSYEVLRKGPADNTFLQIGTTTQSEYVDGTAQWSTPYLYQVLARSGKAQSPLSQAVAANHPDTFPPATPNGLVTSTTADAVELSWERNTESDLKGYYVYRSTDGKKFDRAGDLVNVPTYTDHAVEHGKTYFYRVSAIDQTGLESPQSTANSVAFP